MSHLIIVLFGEKLLYIKKKGIYQVALNYPRSDAVARKAVYGSEGMALGTGCHTLLLCGWVFVSGLLIYR